MKQGPLKTHSFLLRLWQSVDGGRIVWRALLEEMVSRDRRGFGNLKDLTAYLEELTGEDPCPGDESKQP
jgi:hypothetical protein